MGRKVLILGNGVAGFTAAATIREHDKECAIVLMTIENELFYNRMTLSKALADEKLLQDIYMEPKLWYEENHVRTMMLCRVLRIDTGEKYVEYERVDKQANETSRGGVLVKGHERESYDVLIYALGASAYLPPIAGITQRGVVTIRSIADAVNAQELLKESQRVVVIGGGIMGLEIAWQCHKAGKQACVVEGNPRLMEKQLDREGSEFLAHLLQCKGVDVRCGKRVLEVTTDMDKAAICGVMIADAEVESENLDAPDAKAEYAQAKEETIPCDMVIVACGIVPNIKPAVESGLGVGGGVMVDYHMQTSVEGIFACGDCVQIHVPKNTTSLPTLGAHCEPTTTHGLWGEGKEMGVIAGRNALAYLNGESERFAYETGESAFYFNGFDTVIFSIGQTEIAPDSTNDWCLKKGVTHQEYRDASAGRYEKYYYHQNELVGAILIGSPDKMKEVNERIGVRQKNRVVQPQQVMRG